MVLFKTHSDKLQGIVIFSLFLHIIFAHILLTQTKLAWRPQCSSSHGGLSLAGSSGNQSPSFFLLIIQPLPNYSLWTLGWGATTAQKVETRWGVIGAHALCIISYSEEDSTASRNQSSQQCTEVSAEHTNEGATFARRNIWLKSRCGEHGKPVLSLRMQC